MEGPGSGPVTKYKANRDDVLKWPFTDAQLYDRLNRLLPTRLIKVGQAYTDRVDQRTCNASHYNPEFFARESAVCIATGFETKAIACDIETKAIAYVKKLGRCVNATLKGAIPHDGYHAGRTGALYAVPTVTTFKNVAEFHEKHVSWFRAQKKKGKQGAEQAAKQKQAAKQAAEQAAKQAAKQKKAAKLKKKAAKQKKKAEKNLKKWLAKWEEAEKETMKAAREWKQACIAEEKK